MPDRFAYSNALRDVHPVEKIVFAFSCMVISLISGSIPVHSLVLIIMSAVVLLIAGIPLRYYVGIMSKALAFVLFGCAAVAYGAVDLNGAMLVFFRAAAAISCFYFLILTTPAADILYILKKIPIPSIIIELMGLTYRFIFVFMEIMQKTRTAQTSRLGYDGLKNSYRSMGVLIAGLFARMFRQVDSLNTALESRGFTGELNVMQREFKSSAVNIAAIVVVDALLIYAGVIFTGLR
ncbi:MAG: cobalt ECF transporter T component CbiQ [Nitrospirae bacterium]|nr:cobalt ECF transporter T component CbiQ [Nitrospirota bacterium]